MTNQLHHHDRCTAGDAWDAALADARARVCYDHERDDFTDYAVPWAGLGDGSIAETLGWAMSAHHAVLMAAVESNRLDDADGAAPMPAPKPRTYLFGRDPDDAPQFVVRGSFVNRYDDERVAVETPPPWETPDDLTGGNEIIKSLPWGDDDTPAGDDREGAHYSFEDAVHRIDAENVWVIDADYVPDLRELATEAGYEWVDDASMSSSPDEDTLATLVDSLRTGDYDHDTFEWVGGDTVEVRYESKRSGDIKTKTGMATSKRSGDGHEFAFERADGKFNRVEADGGDVGIYSTSRYPFMGTVVSVTVLPEGGPDGDGN